MLKTISVSNLRAHIKRVLNEVGYGQSEYLVEKSNKPTAAIINLEDFRLLQEIKRQKQSGSAAGETSFLSKLQAIHQSLQVGGYQPRSKSAIDAQIQAERESWGA
jgi:prevent-host-death family protein